MNLEQIIQITENRVQTLRQNMGSAYAIGDLLKYEEWEKELAETELTLTKLKSLQKG